MIFVRFAALALLVSVSPIAEAEERIAWTTSKVKGSPEPPLPYSSEPVWPSIRFQRALDIARLPSRDLMFVVEQRGKIWILPGDLSARTPQPTLFADLKEDLAKFESILGMAFHPNFEENQEVYLFYRTGIKLENGTRISRFKTRPGALKLDPDSEEILLTWLSGGHNGGHLGFGPDGMLYILSGDAEVPSPPDPLNTGQDTSDLLSSVLRIDVDQRDPGLNHRIPQDNPFVNVPGTRPEIWAYGFRNPWKLCFHPRTHDLWVGDVGWELWELLYRVKRGANYGWSIVEGPQPIKPLQDMGPSVISPPTHYYSHAEGASITGGYVSETYRLPGLDGAYLYGDFVTGRVWALWDDGTIVKRNEWIADTRKQIVSFGQAGNGEVVFLDWPEDQTLHRLVSTPEEEEVHEFPFLLSQTGIFKDASSLQPEDGVHEFQIQAPMWQDGASSRYWVAMPGQTGLKTQFNRRSTIPMFRTTKPHDMVLVKTLELEGRKIETQILHFDGFWNGYSYAWNRAETDAELVGPDGGNEMINGRPWRFHSRAECTRCHSGNFTRTLAFLPGQLNRDNQLQQFHQLGMVDDAFLKAAEMQPLAPPNDERESIGLRARSWLHANCSHCHRFSGGGSVPIHMNAQAPLDQANLLGIEPVKGGFGLDASKLIAPGDPYNSVIYYRAATEGVGHMPMLGCSTIDDEGVLLLHDWIASLGPRPTTPIPEKPDTTTNALMLMHHLMIGTFPEPKRAEIREAGINSPNIAINGLFQRFK
ncbi:MAG: PQQ-dependent sugar dehydrogenase [Verrucomicrobiota bacterium]